MADIARLRERLSRIDGRSYPAYRDLKGCWDLEEFELLFDHIQGDPFAAPSRVRVRVLTDIPPAFGEDADAREAVEDWLLRRFGSAAHGSRRGSGRSGELRVYRPGPEVLQRSAVRLEADGTVEVRFELGLPARGRRVLGGQAWALIDEDVRRAVRSLVKGPGLEEHVESVRRQRALRRSLAEAGLVGFVADGSVLPRASGIVQDPMVDAVVFESPASLRVSLSTDEGPVEGMGIPEGVTVIVGGGFHGKSTLLQALQRGHLDHVPGDGREGVVALADTVKVRAEDGRRVCAVDISGFLGTLPGGRSTQPFNTDDASGSTSQAAAIIEAVEAGARLLLLDEDTSATNLLVRDERMRRLVPRSLEPITPLVERVKQIHQAWGISTILVIGGVGDYLAVADTVIGLAEYVHQDLGEAAASVAGPVPEPPGALSEPLSRVPLREGLEPGKIRARDGRRVDYNRQEVDLLAVEQVLDGAHAGSIGHALARLHRSHIDGAKSLATVLDELDQSLDTEGIDVLSPRDTPIGTLIRPRRHEVAAALNRLRTLRVLMADRS